VISTLPSVLQVLTKTSQERGAGTDATVCVELRGSLGSSGRLPLVCTTRNCFERGAVDEFEVACPLLGELKEAVVGHDGKGAAAAWHLAHLQVTDVKAARVSHGTSRGYRGGASRLPASRRARCRGAAERGRSEGPAVPGFAVASFLHYPSYQFVIHVSLHTVNTLPLHSKHLLRI
jgi:hypothetical protein